MNRTQRIVPLLAFWLAAAWAAEAPKAPPKEPPSEVPATPEAVQERLAALEAARELPAEVRDAAVKLYRDALPALEAQALHARKAAELERLNTGAPTALRELEARRKDLAEAPELKLPADLALAAAQAQLDQARADLKAAADRLAKLQTEAADAPARRKKLPDLLRAAKDRGTAVAEQQAALPLPSDPPAVAAARAAFVHAQLAAAQAEARHLEQEVASTDALDKLLPLRLEVAGAEERQARQRADTLQNRVDDLRRAQAELARQQAEAQLRAAAHPAVKGLATEIVDLSKLRAGPEGLVAKMEALNEAIRSAQKQLAGLQADFQRIQKRMQIAGMTNVLGVLLREHRAELPNLRRLRQSIAARQSVTADVELLLVDLRERRSDLRSIEEDLRARLERLFPPVSDAERPSLESRLRDLLTQHRQLLQQLLEDTNAYFTALVELDSLERQLIAETEAFADFIDEHVLWIRSAAPLHWREVPRTVQAVLWVLGATQIASLLRAAWEELIGQPALYGFFLLLVLGLVVLRRTLFRRLHEFAEKVADYRSDLFLYSLRALLCTVLAALPGPVIFWVVGWGLSTAHAAGDFPKAVGVALWQAGWIYFPLEIFRVVCRPRGLGEVHFRWREQTVTSTRHTIELWLTSVLPLLAVVVLLEHQPSEAHRGSLGRAAFLAAMVLSSGMVFRLLSVRGPLFAAAVTRADRQLLVRTRSLWFPPLVAAPLVLAVVAAMGYLFTAVHLFSGLLLSFLLALGLILARALTLRWLSIQRRRVALRHMQMREEEEKARRGAPGTAGPDTIQVTAVEHVASLMEIREQTLSLIAWGTAAAGVLGLYVIWVDVLPALGILHQIRLWGGPDAVGGVVSLAHLLLALGVAAVAAIVARNLPGLLEVTLLHWLAVAPGTRYAMMTVARYAVGVVALVIAATLLGLRWSSIQWLIAALTVGLGFGLQEIFANFVSGLIILFERPIRIGDTVTIGDTHGTVTRIRIRATTITDWDRKELIVPNKEFITGRLINWTLSDRVIRIHVPVGIAYGSDTQKATDILLRAAATSPDVLREPKPEALFLQFGNSSLHFELRAYVEGYEHYHSAISDLHRRIDADFRAAGIVIAFPQADLHIRSIEVPFKVLAEPVARAAPHPDPPPPPPPGPGPRPREGTA